MLRRHYHLLQDASQIRDRGGGSAVLPGGWALRASILLTTQALEQLGTSLLYDPRTLVYESGHGHSAHVHNAWGQLNCLPGAVVCVDWYDVGRYEGFECLRTAC